MERFEFTPSGVCAVKMVIEVEDGIIKSYRAIGGCPGNSLGIAALVKDMEVDEAISRLEGIRCAARQSSCPDQLAKALIKFKEQVHN